MYCTALHPSHDVYNFTSAKIFHWSWRGFKTFKVFFPALFPFWQTFWSSKRKPMNMWFFQATKLVLELTIFYSQTLCELWLKTKLSFLTSTEAWRRRIIFINRREYIFQYSVFQKNAIKNPASRSRPIRAQHVMTTPLNTGKLCTPRLLVLRWPGDFKKIVSNMNWSS